MVKSILLFIAFFTSLIIQGGCSKTLIIKNNCFQTLWSAVRSYPDNSAPTFQSFKIDPPNYYVFNTPNSWRGQIWARTYCYTNDSGTLVCLTGDCGDGLDCNSSDIEPATLVVFKLLGDDEDDGYYISLINGFNLPVSVTPSGGTMACTAVSCLSNINVWCPPVLQVKGPDRSMVVGCKSACTYFNSDQYCCRGDYSSPSTCQPSNYSQVFKNLCPHGCSYPYDGDTCYFQCMGTEYNITFCP